MDATSSHEGAAPKPVAVGPALRLASSALAWLATIVIACAAVSLSRTDQATLKLFDKLDERVTDLEIETRGTVTIRLIAPDDSPLGRASRALEPACPSCRRDTWDEAQPLPQPGLFPSDWPTPDEAPPADDQPVQEEGDESSPEGAAPAGDDGGRSPYDVPVLRVFQAEALDACAAWS